jgi:type IV secretory pathway VirB10-like protein
MITISLTLNVSLDAADLAALDARLAALARGMARLTESAEAPQSHTEPTPSADLRAVSADSVNPDPKPQNALKRGKPTPRPPKMAALGGTPVLPPVFPATTNGDGTQQTPTAVQPQRREEREEEQKPDESLGDLGAFAVDAPGRLPFAEFDELVRAEMKRLSMDGRIPSYKLWDSERDRRLPSLAGLLYRYKVGGIGELAPVFGLEPPLSVTKEKQL